jgi:hypothetical protein
VVFPGLSCELLQLGLDVKEFSSKLNLKLVLGQVEPCQTVVEPGASIKSRAPLQRRDKTKATSKIVPKRVTQA